MQRRHTCLDQSFAKKHLLRSISHEPFNQHIDAVSAGRIKFPTSTGFRGSSASGSLNIDHSTHHSPTPNGFQQGCKDCALNRVRPINLQSQPDGSGYIVDTRSLFSAAFKLFITVALHARAIRIPYQTINGASL